MPGKKPPRHATSGPARTWSLADIQELLDVLAGREITEFEMKQAGVKIRIRRGNLQAGYESGPPEVYVAPAGAITPPPASTSPVSSASSAATASSEPASETAEGLFIMKSPIVGTFYSAPSPNAPPFAKTGDVVEVGQVLCIIEAMKLMNELESEVAGKVVRVYVESGQPVEYGQSLFAIEPSPK